MSLSHLNRLRNEIENIEEESDRLVSDERCYVVVISFSCVSEKQLSEWSREIVLDKKNQPLFVYIRKNELFVFYPPAEEHFLKGSHQKICSYYTSLYTSDKGGKVTVHLTELETQHTVFAYLLWKNIEAQFHHLSTLSGIPLDKMYQMTLQEALEKAPDKWGKSSRFEKYGTVYKLREKKGKMVLSSFSKPVDSRRRDHYLAYLFGRPEAH